MYKSTKDIIMTRISRGGRGRILFLQDMDDVAEHESVKKAFQRLTKEGVLTRLTQGIYLYPQFDEELGIGMLIPVRAIARRDKIRVAPNAPFAQNALGLSAQVPANTVYYTDGPGRRIKVGQGKGILFLHTSDMSRFAFRSNVMQLIVTALTDYGEKNITEAHLETIRPFLAHVTEKQFAHDVKLAPIWLQEKLKAL